jgi:hypothetical protein
VTRLDNLKKDEAIYEVDYAINPDGDFSENSEDYTECLSYLKLNFTYE